ncbi:hypothetical protein OG818_30290 [Streptomyces virginiae]|uniref:hypothetical protein n=1 Tax=Streptomyces virginiae TaxID=1961 RepID=UPI00225BF54A|nr:hypothetical protein [Streptomyces virginiae]MCX4720015.1 hypothetical protein [Streptomyces virginiae]
MPHIIRTLAVSGAAAVALLAATPAASAGTPEQNAAVVQAAVDKAAGAPVTLPSGKTMSVRGLDSAAYRADAGHHQAVVTLAEGTGVGAPIQGPATQLGGTTQVQTQAGSGAALGAGAVLALILGVVLFFGIKGNKVSKGWAFTSMAMGVVLAGTFIGPLVTQLGGTGVQAFGNLFSGL